MHIGIQYRDFGSEEESLHGKRMKRHVLILLQFKRHGLHDSGPCIPREECKVYNLVFL